MRMNLSEFESCFGTDVESVLDDLKDGENCFLIAKFNAKNQTGLVIEDYSKEKNYVDLSVVRPSDELQRHYRRLRDLVGWSKH